MALKPIKINPIYPRKPLTVEQRKRYTLNQKTRQKVLKKEFVDLKGGNCEICGNKFPLVCYDFHHRDPSEKEQTIRTLIRRFSKEEDKEYILEEVEKCDLLCANCHRIIHHEDY